MSQADSLTALVDYYGLKKEGKVTGDGEPSLGASGKVKATGMMPILHVLDTKEPLLGSGPLEKALVRQWVMFLTGCLEPAERKEKLSLLRRVNEHLATNSHLAGAALTAADVLMFHSIHKIFSELTFQEKDKLVHLSRWVVKMELKLIRKGYYNNNLQVVSVSAAGSETQEREAENFI